MLQAQEHAIRQIQQAAFDQLKLVSASNEYPKLLMELICQSLVKLMEDSVQVVCRAADDNLVLAAIPQAQEFFKNKYNRTVQITIDQKNRLHQDSSGGVVLSAQTGKILCLNTLEQRLQLAYEQRLPEIRALLFGSNYL